MGIDLYFIDLMKNIKNGFLDTIFASIILNKVIYIWIILVIILIAMKKTRKLGIIVGISFVITYILGESVLKHLIARERPFITYNYELIIKKPNSFSFPSASTALSFAVFGGFLFSKHKYSILIGIIAAVVAISRIYLGVHYFSDVLGGIILGVLVSYLVSRVYDKKLNKKV